MIIFLVLIRLISLLTDIFRRSTSNSICSVIRYKESFTRLRSLKTEIEHLQHLLEKAKVKMQKDFEIWWAEQAAFNQVYNHCKNNGALCIFFCLFGPSFATRVRGHPLIIYDTRSLH